jgi:predicted XRE-type DNA-binding protein
VLAGRVAAVITYTVRAKPWAHGWELHIDRCGATQSRTLHGAEKMVRDYLALETGEPPGSFDIQIIPDIGEDLEMKAKSAREAVAAADKAQRAAAIKHREIAHELKRKGLSGRDIAVVLRVSPQRVSQLLRGTSLEAPPETIRPKLRHRVRRQA